MAPRLSRDEYTVGWVCALPIELAAAGQLNLFDVFVLLTPLSISHYYYMAASQHGQLPLLQLVLLYLVSLSLSLL